MSQPNAFNSQFATFLQSEYNSVAQAHFNTNQSVSSFFNYYILILSISITGGTAAANFFLKHQEIPAYSSLLSFTAAGLIAVSAIGYVLLGYISNLRFDAILYARSVNGIRKYFFNQQQFTPAQEQYIRALPKGILFPRYREYTYFFFVVIAFAIINTCSLLAGLYLTHQLQRYILFPSPVLDLATICGTFAAMHFVLYIFLANHRENAYIRSHTIGIDVDGVLNDHRTTFCNTYAKLFGKKIDPASITTIPVHECPGLDITREQEHEVFHNTAYWVELPVTPKAAEAIDTIRNQIGCKVHIFTSRPWPQSGVLSPEMTRSYSKSWSAVSIDDITRNWLRAHNIQYDQLTIEKSIDIHFDSAIVSRFFRFLLRNRLLNKNRFRLVAEKRYRYFIEDDLSKAIRLSHLCDIVFLVTQPYNQSDSYIPSNIIRVRDLSEVVHHIRDLL